VTWLSIDDHFDEEAAYESLSDRAHRLHVAALAFSARNETDGFIPKTRASRLVPGTVTPEHIAELLEPGLWTDAGDDYLVTDFLTKHGNKSRAWWVDYRQKNHDAKVAGGLASAAAREEKYGTAIPPNATNRPEQKPNSQLGDTSAEDPAEQKPNIVTPSPSPSPSSSLSQKSITTTATSANSRVGDSDARENEGTRAVIAAGTAWFAERGERRASKRKLAALCDLALDGALEPWHLVTALDIAERRGHAEGYHPNQVIEYITDGHEVSDGRGSLTPARKATMTTTMDLRTCVPLPAVRWLVIVDELPALSAARASRVRRHVAAEAHRLGAQASEGRSCAAPPHPAA